MSPSVRNIFYNKYDIEYLPGMDRADDHRTTFQLDRDRVLFSYPFRSLQSKTQVFQSGEYDFYRTRLTHSIEVARISRSICDYLKATSKYLSDNFYIDPDLVDAVGLAHDMGHPPFGHVGERRLNELMRSYGGFEGNAQTLRILTELLYRKRRSPYGMSPSRAFLDGVLKYKKLFSEACIVRDGEVMKYPENHYLYDQQEKYRIFAIGDDIPESMKEGDALNDFKSIECQIMDWADDAAYSLHDILDGITAGFITIDKIERWAHGAILNPLKEGVLDKLIGSIKKGNIEAVLSRQVGEFVMACKLEESDRYLSDKTNRYKFTLGIDPVKREECNFYKQLTHDLIFEETQIQQKEFKGGLILERIFEALWDNYVDISSKSLKIMPLPFSSWVENESSEAGKMRRICDYIADMTDNQAIRIYKRLFDPEFGSITDLT